MPYKSGKASDKLREDIGDIYIYLQQKTSYTEYIKSYKPVKVRPSILSYPSPAKDRRLE